jgi:hypothetical protein
MARPAKLDEQKQRTVCACLSLGATRLVAGGIVGCTPRTIRETMLRDPAFAEQVAAAETRREVVLLQKIQSAADKDWRAAAWLLSRFNRSAFGNHGAAVLTKELVSEMQNAMAEEIVAGMPEELQDPMLDRLDGVAKEYMDYAERYQEEHGKPAKQGPRRGKDEGGGMKDEEEANGEVGMRNGEREKDEFEDEDDDYDKYSDEENAEYEKWLDEQEANQHEDDESDTADKEGAEQDGTDEGSADVDNVDQYEEENAALRELVKAFWAEREGQRKDEGGGMKNEAGGRERAARGGVAAPQTEAPKGAEETEETRRARGGPLHDKR